MEAALLPPPSLIDAFLDRIVTLNRLRLDDDTRVAFLPSLTAGRDRSGYVA